MDNLQDKISDILKDPQALEQIKSLGSMLGLSDNSVQNNSQNTVDKSPVNPSFMNQEVNSSPLGNMQNNDLLGNMLSGVGGISGENLQMITKLMPLIQSINQEDETTKLLNAVAPFLSEEKREKVEKAKKMVHLLKVLPLLRNGGLF